MRRVETPVLVVGAGPVGLMTSLLLARLGIASYVVDRREGPHRAPQAHVVNPRTLEICRSIGLDTDELRRHATPREDGSHVSWVTTLTGEELGRLPYERQGDENLLYTPTPLLNLPQHRFEPLLLEKVRAQTAAAVAYGHEWEALEDDGLGVTSRIRELADDSVYEIRSRYVLATDGASSRVRKSLGIELIGPDSLQTFVMIHFEANLRPLVGHRTAILYWTMDPECAGTFVAHDIDGTWVFMHPFDATCDRKEDFTASTCEQIVRRAIGAADVDVTIRDISVWTMTAQVAEYYGSGRVFLVGDSAHRFPPSGGMGMNTGIQDAHNLVWKLHAVEAGWAGASLLSTYETERRPVAQHNADQSVNNAMRMLEVLEALGLSMDRSARQPPIATTLATPGAKERLGAAIANQQEHFDMFGLQLGFRYHTGAVVDDDHEPPPCTNPVRDFVPTTKPGARLPHAWVEYEGRRCSTLDLIGYDGLTLLVGDAGDAWERAATAFGHVPLRCLRSGRDFRDSEGLWASTCEIGRDGALLVRPDQHIAWRAHAATGDAESILACAIQAVVRPTCDA